MLALERARAQAAQERAECVEARAAVQSIGREAEARERRRQAIATELKSWSERGEKANAQIAEIADRQEKTRAELETLADAPTAFLAKHRALIGEIDAAEAAQRGASDQRAAMEAQPAA